MTKTTKPDAVADAMEAKGYISAPAAERRWGISRQTLYSWHTRGLIGGEVVGEKRLFLILDERLIKLLGPLYTPPQTTPSLAPELLPGEKIDFKAARRELRRRPR